MGKRHRKIGRAVFFALGVVVIALVIWHWELIRYGLSQARGQLHIIWNARPVEQYLADPLFPDSLKAKLQLVQEAREYAVDSLGLKDTENYTTLFDQQGKEVMWVVTASERFRLVPKEWTFPLLGAVPYKGFFDRAWAMKVAAELEAEGWDVSVRNPGGWSTLGWFTDPILSKMLEEKPGELASLIIHEMVHATIFVKDSVTFNENLASFIGDRGAEMFLIHRFGPDSQEYQDFTNGNHDYEKFVGHVLRGTRKLDSLYQSMGDDVVEVKAEKKEKMIREIVSAMDTLHLLSGRKAGRRLRENLPNNSFFMSYIHYESGQDELTREWEQSFDRNLRAFISFMSARYPFL